MIEMLGVLAIVGVLSAGGIAGYSMAMQSYKTNQLIDKMQIIATKVRTLYKQGDYTGLTNTVLKNSGKISSSDLENPFGGELQVRRSGLTVNSFHIDAHNIPSETCVDILQTYWGQEDALARIHVRDSSNTNKIVLEYGLGNYPAAFSDILNYCNEDNLRIYVIFK